MMEQIKMSNINQSNLKGSLVEKARKTLKKDKPSFLDRFQGKRSQIGKQGLIELLRKRSHNNQLNNGQLFEIQKSHSHMIKMKTQVIDQQQIRKRFRNQREPQYQNYRPMGNLELFGFNNMADEGLKVKSERIDPLRIKRDNVEEREEKISRVLSKVKRFKTNDDQKHRRCNNQASVSQLPEVHQRNYKVSDVVLSQPSSPRAVKYSEPTFLTKEAKLHLRHLQLFEKKLNKVQSKLQYKS